MMGTAIFTLLFILIVSLVGGYFIYKADKKWEDELMKYIDEKTSKKNENNENKKVEANARTFKFN